MHQRSETFDTRLEQTCDNPLVREPLIATRARIGQVSKRQGDLIKKRNDSDAWAKSDRQELATDPLPVRTEQLLERAAINESVVAKCQAELAEVERELALLIQREELLREQTLVP